MRGRTCESFLPEKLLKLGAESPVGPGFECGIPRHLRLGSHDTAGPCQCANSGWWVACTVLLVWGREWGLGLSLKEGWHLG